MVACQRGEAGIPLDLFQAEYPSLWIQKASVGHRMLFINWSDEEMTLSLDLRAHGIDSSKVVDFWTGEGMNTSNGRMEVKMQPHASYLGVTGF
jgi:hypothetical protein